LRALKVEADGMEINHELVFEALTRGMNMVEVPANLEWRSPPLESTGSIEAKPARRSSMRTGAHMWSVLTSGFRHRPAMALALPALIPGLLPLVLMVVLVLRPSHAVLVNTTLVTMVIQLSSLGFLMLMTGSYVRRLRALTRRASLPDDRTISRA